MRTTLVALLVLAAACTDSTAPLVSPDPRPLSQSHGTMFASVDAEPWNSWAVSAYVEPRGYLIVEGLAFEDDEAYRTIRLSLKAEVGTPQEIGPDNFITADVRFIAWYANSQSWSAGGNTGSGTFTITSLTDEGAKGTFSFTARALTSISSPTDFRVTEGTFDVRFR